jgi:hypothetical protein
MPLGEAFEATTPAAAAVWPAGVASERAQATEAMIASVPRSTTERRGMDGEMKVMGTPER